MIDRKYLLTVSVNFNGKYSVHTVAFGNLSLTLLPLHHSETCARCACEDRVFLMRKPDPTNGSRRTKL
jgi:hypothetical protein